MLLPQIIGGLLMKGDKPDVPSFKAISTTDEMRKAIEGNQANFGRASKLASDVNAANQEQMLAMFRNAIPGFDKIQGLQSDVIQSQLKGEIPQSLVDLIQNSTAANALSRGVGGSGFQANLFKSGLVREGLAQTQRGLDSAARWIGQTASFSLPNMFNIGSMFVTPQQRIEVATHDRDFKFQRDWLKSQIRAAPDPTLSAIGGAIVKTDDQLMSVASSVLGAAAGGALGCWIAREVFGNDNPQWLAFWAWKEFVGPRWFREWYAANGERFAGWIKDKPGVKAHIRAWMLSKIA